MTHISNWGEDANQVYRVGSEIRSLSQHEGEAHSIVVVLSGGMDSATLLALAHYMKPEKMIGLTFDYGQRHDKEIEKAKELGWHYEVDVRTIPLNGLAAIFRTALSKSSDIAIPDHAREGTIPPTYVPFRNSIFLSIALGYAESWGYDKVFYGANAVDYSGYPDCRPAFLDSMNMVAYSYDTKISVEAPVMYLSKSEIVKLGSVLKVPWEKTWSCYRGEHQACGKCPSCEFRIKGFKEADIKDPIAYAR